MDMTSISKKFNDKKPILQSLDPEKGAIELQQLIDSIEKELGYKLGVDYRTDAEIKELEKQGLKQLQAL